MGINNLLYEFLKTIITFDFLWIVVATTATMELLKKIPFFGKIRSVWYPLWTLGIALFWVTLKTAWTGEWNEILANFLFTAILADVLYTFAGKYIIEGIIFLFKKIIGLLPSPPEDNNKQ